MSNLVERLCIGLHPVELSLRPERTAQALKGCLERGYIHVKFTNTKGGTVLGIPIDKEATDVTRLDLENGTGAVKIVGKLTLDYVPVTCIASITLPEFAGEGCLVRDTQSP